VETHRKVFVWVLGVIADRGLLKGKTVGVDATTLEANAAMRSIIRRDSGASYDEFLTDLARQSGSRRPPGRPGPHRPEAQEEDIQSGVDESSDPDARIAKMKDGSTHLAHKAEHAVDMTSGAVIAVTLQAADQGDTTRFRKHWPRRPLIWHI